MIVNLQLRILKPKYYFDITETALVFRLDCWVEDYNKERKAKDWILIEILDRFKSKGIGIPFPHLTVKQE